MQCELCGAPIQGPSKTIQIEGAELCVCLRCAKHGTEVQQPRRRGAPQTKPGVAVPQARRRPRDVFDLMEGELVSDYADRIRVAREGKEWSTLDLAQAIRERELLVKKIEKGDLIPEDDVRRKLEKALDIRLIDSAEDSTSVGGPGRVTMTVGDVISFKKGRK
ncbi:MULTISPECIES: multiprotein bridging factor aMBF1 [unclassified Methanoculleus]|uniref:multiprotein bridging factor aMBF1 n=1 Tax=unclassified Methanoculleus TaxID=2619537 RepID=UPI0025E135DD|nr:MULTISPECIES: multiprotein bridging factor aMBF1 [unclassified Methanoculleus]MCK9317100.1 multiprotein bridging factor aMBF1 [Methanoculleus sp.]MDD2253409.1 multiprotein bridging factor aMBF1 [Methanoculleus sp.]MDD2788897.1 multiprotein bridging factor aMBF1 [Methanoculleus sp.]MDD3215012.1 multiprotein bridging factor aMBF1 [Methanoculleus sp.]MDD4313986.1 multiprotein bridging factor aMBF1 [Methanoculleus sp.]